MGGQHSTNENSRIFKIGAVHRATCCKPKLVSYPENGHSNTGHPNIFIISGSKRTLAQVCRNPFNGQPLTIYWHIFRIMVAFIALDIGLLLVMICDLHETDALLVFPQPSCA